MYARLEERVGRLEQGGLSLDEAIAVYEEGMALARRCQDQLDRAELKITKLKESFAALPHPQDAAAAATEPDDYEYVADDAALDDEEFP
ncbi:MAG: exodeoxyribonuclease VII small subunit [Chloroflexota bacterium]|nr:exodeoxyribonuclease VII small subunit [Chloroflexota bacterium]